jgi:hypothetical protein
MTTTTTISHLHDNIHRKLDGYFMTNRIPHLLFHGSHGTGKRTLVYYFINQIYGGDKHKLKTNVMFVNCAHGKGIKFIRDDLKYFAKTNIQGTQGVSFKTIVLFNADSLTIDAQSALRRCIELFSYNTRFFIVVENKHKLLNPILSRFCEIYVPEYLDISGNIVNLHQYQLEHQYGSDETQKKAKRQWFSTHYDKITEKTYKELVQLVNDAYEEGLSSLDMMEWVQHLNIPEGVKYETSIYYHSIKAEYFCEKMLMLIIIGFVTKTV